MNRAGAAGRWLRLLLFLGGTGLWQAGAAAALTITDAQALAAGKRLWQNECGGTVSGLTSWNAGEDFASLGIGHYIWYPAGQRGPFEERFPELVQFLARQPIPLPAWLRHPEEGCPWKTRQAFEADRASERMGGLRELLASSVALQARFSANRLEAALPKMLAAAPAGASDRVRAQFYRVAASPNGVYALLDYVNFKGEGVLQTERYNGRGWGLLQVLDGMQSDPSLPPGQAAAREFAASAARVLTQRVAASPPDRHEARWLAGWKGRTATYASNP